MIRNELLFCAALAAFLPGCSSSPPEAASTRDADLKVIKNTESAWNRDARDPDKFVSYYAEDASVLLPNEAVLNGRQAIIGAYKAMAADPNFSLSFESNKGDVARSGDLGYTQGTYSLTTTDPKTKKPVTDKGKYVTVYRKQADGSWKAVSDILNSDLPAAGASAATKQPTSKQPKTSSRRRRVRG